ncbi:alpha/beta hydrolase [Rhodophyticola porphyridii]|uniref:alpha/beta hydrolase n=1 Tax=Rhodophyticola porphyridii TaxID=1852017 RepID=UPI0035D0194C
MSNRALLSFGGASPRRAARGLVLAHGRGGSAADILDLGAALGLPDVALAAPDAIGQSWWPTSFLAPHAQMAPYLEAGLHALDRAVEALVEGGLARDRIAVAGFSQGACLALEYGARSADLGAVIGLSGGLVGTGDAGGGATDALYGYGPKLFDYDNRLEGTPVVIAVHARDPHIPLARAEDSAKVFRTLGAEVELQVTPGDGHGITGDGMAAMRRLLNR